MITAILLDILLPILVMVGLGAWVRWKFAVDLSTLTKINIYLFVPAFVFEKVATSTLSWSDMGGVVLVTLVHVAALGIIVWGLGRIFRVGRKTLAAIALAVMFYNSGNFGLPLAELAYPEGREIAAAAHQASILNVFVRILKLPVLYVLAAALGARLWLDAEPGRTLPTLLAKPAEYLAAGLVPIALVTLGAQLASRPRWPRWKPVSLVLLLRLVFGPVQMALLLWGFHALGWGPLDLWPWPAELLVLTAAVPTAVNTLLLTLELDGDAELAADCVFWTTVFSCVTITGWLVVIRLMSGP